MMDSLDNITPIITTTTSSSGRGIANTTFLHFNDVYNIEKAPCFVTSLTNARINAKVRSKSLPGKADGGGNSSSILCRVRRRSKVVTLFSGDAFSPSMMSTVLKGRQMIPVLNACNIDAACLGESLRKKEEAVVSLCILSGVWFFSWMIYFCTTFNQYNILLIT